MNAERSLGRVAPSAGRPASIAGPGSGDVATLNVSESGLLKAGPLTIGGTSGSSTPSFGRAFQTGGAIITNGGALTLALMPASEGTYDQSGGTLSTGLMAIGQSGVGTLTQSGGGLVTNGSPISSGGSGTFTQTGGSVDTGAGLLTIASAANTTGDYTLAGGTLQVARITRFADTTASGRPVFDGGTLRPTAASAIFIRGLTSATVRAGGATFNTGFVVTVPQPLLHDPLLGNTPDGGLTKTGTARLTLTGLNTYTGPTVAKGGVLQLSPDAQTVVLTGPGGGDLQGGTLAFTYTGVSPTPQIKALLDAAAPGGFATGQIRATAKAAGQTIGYRDNGVDTVTLRLTLPGDADLDGDVDFNDFLTLQTSFGMPGRASIRVISATIT